MVLFLETVNIGEKEQSRKEEAEFSVFLPAKITTDMAKNMVRFDWAMKKILRHKANFDILEGFLTELLGEEIKIIQILESESNQERDDDKHNRVDILVENAKGELVIIEVQNSKQYDYFHRMLYGTVKVITEHIVRGNPYSEVRKVISVTIAYFDLGQGEDYVYHGTNVFRGIHKNDVLALAEKQIELYNKAVVHEVFPEYWVIKVDQFDGRVKDKLDEWIYFFKNSEIKKGFSAKGLKEASERLIEMNLTDQEAKEYKRYLRYLHDVASDQQTLMIDEKDRQKYAEEIEQMKRAAAEMAQSVAELHRSFAEVERVAKESEVARQEAEQMAKEAERSNVEAAEAREKDQADSMLRLSQIGLDPETIAKSLGIDIGKVRQTLQKGE